MGSLDNWFEAQAARVDKFTSTSRAFAGACAIVVVWALLGPPLNYSDTWQLSINTGTTIVTFLMVFLLQNSQSRGAQRDREAAERDADINRRAYEVLRIVEDHVEESRKLHTATLKLLDRIEKQEKQELEILQNDASSTNLPSELNQTLSPE